MLGPKCKYLFLNRRQDAPFGDYRQNSGRHKKITHVSVLDDHGRLLASNEQIFDMSVINIADVNY